MGEKVREEHGKYWADQALMFGHAHLLTSRPANNHGAPGFSHLLVTNDRCALPCQEPLDAGLHANLYPYTPVDLIEDLIDGEDARLLDAVSPEGEITGHHDASYLLRTTTDIHGNSDFLHVQWQAHDPDDLPVISRFQLRNGNEFLAKLIDYPELLEAVHASLFPWTDTDTMLRRHADHLRLIDWTALTDKDRIGIDVLKQKIWRHIVGGAERSDHTKAYVIDDGRSGRMLLGDITYDRPVGEVPHHVAAATERRASHWMRIVRHSGGAFMQAKPTREHTSEQGWKLFYCDDTILNGVEQGYYLGSVPLAISRAMPGFGNNTSLDYLIFLPARHVIGINDNLTYLTYITRSKRGSTHDADDIAPQLSMNFRMPREDTMVFVKECVHNPELLSRLLHKIFEDEFTSGAVMQEQAERLCIISGNQLLHAGHSAETIFALFENALQSIAESIARHQTQLAEEQPKKPTTFYVQADGISRVPVSRTYPASGASIRPVLTVNLLHPVPN